MPKIAYVEKNFRDKKLDVIDKVNEIVARYKEMNLSLTLRQVYYQMVSQALIPNNEREYKNLGDTISDGRMAGMIDWLAIEDRTRNLRSNSHWGHPGSIIESAAWSYALDKWKDQDMRVEVWVEKDALIGVLESACVPLDVPFFSCRGYVSQSEMWVAAQRLRDWEKKGVSTTVIHLGDHDPSGIDMSRDIQNRLWTFGSGVTVERIALTMEQIDEYNPPPNPAKTTDVRYASYMELYGTESWELDALRPEIIIELIRDKVTEYRDDDKFNAVVEQEKKDKHLLNEVAKRWDDVASYIENTDDDDPKNDDDEQECTQCGGLIFKDDSEWVTDDEHNIFCCQECRDEYERMKDESDR